MSSIDAAETVGTGRLRVRVDDQSYFLSTSLPFVVRDARLAVVRRGVTGQPDLELVPGLYSVEAITPRGRSMTELVQVGVGETSELVVTEDSGREEDPQPAPGSRGGGQAELLATQGCALTVRDASGWEFGPDQTLLAVPTATFDVDGRQWVVALPLNPVARRPEEATCRVEVGTDPGASWLGIRFSPKRRVGRTLDGLLRHHEVMSSGALLDEASELLLHKYSDPAAAALGGLTLQRLGQLRQRQRWVENLAEDFEWIPDGRVLLAGLLMLERADLDRGLDLLLAATSERPMYTDGLSLATELLRRWPGEERKDERMARLGALAEYSCVADWEAVALTTRSDVTWS